MPSHFYYQITIIKDIQFDFSNPSSTSTQSLNRRFVWFILRVTTISFAEYRNYIKSPQNPVHYWAS